MIKFLAKNPMTLWLIWVIRTLILKSKYLDRSLNVEYLASINNCHFGKFNRICTKSILSEVEIGDMSYIGQFSRLSKVKIGKFSCIGPEVLIGLGVHPTRDFVSIHPAFYSAGRRAQTTYSQYHLFKETREVLIGNDVWVGARAIILDGVAIGDGAIIGAGAVVTKDIPAYAIVGGVPAKIIRYRFNETQVSSLLVRSWWNEDLDILRNNYKLFSNIDNFLNSELLI
jgi:acetyltransferase-like isoleucine patch superfamily enzyme